MYLAKILTMKIQAEFEYEILSNGIQLVHKYVPYAKVAHIGFTLDIGSRDETAAEAGIAHFWEHMAFKGTQKRKYYHIIQSLESVGGELNAFTTKEKICFYASIFNEYFYKAADILSDITFQASFPEKEIEKERGVILEEMAMYQDTPEDSIHDEFDEMVFRNHSLGMNILGTKASIEHLSRPSFFQFIDRQLDTESIVVATLGNLSFNKVKKTLCPRLAEIPSKKSQRNRRIFHNYEPSHLVKNRDGALAHAVIGGVAPSISDPDRLPYFLILNLLAGAGMNSRLNMNLREKRGLVYSVESNYTPFFDTGSLSIYFASDPPNLSRCMTLVQGELKKIHSQPLTALQLHRAIKQLKGQLAMAEENNVHFMLMMGKSMLDTGKIESLATLFAELDALTPSQVHAVTERCFQPSQQSSLWYRP